MMQLTLNFDTNYITSQRGWINHNVGGDDSYCIKNHIDQIVLLDGFPLFFKDHESARNAAIECGIIPMDGVYFWDNGFKELINKPKNLLLY